MVKGGQCGELSSLGYSVVNERWDTDYPSLFVIRVMYGTLFRFFLTLARTAPHIAAMLFVQSVGNV